MAPEAAWLLMGWAVRAKTIVEASYSVLGVLIFDGLSVFIEVKVVTF